MKPGNKKNAAPFMLLIIIALAAAGVYAEARHNIISDAFRQSQKRLLPDGIEFEYESEAIPVFSGGKDGFLCVTPDGVVYFSYKGEARRLATFTLQSPHVVKNGETWAVLDPRGRSVYVCSQNGVLYTVNLEYPVLNAYLNDIQCLILVLETEAGYKIRIYNSLGEETLTRNYELDGVYPVCAALSDDGYIFAVSCLDTTKTSLSSNIQYFYTDSGAKKYGADPLTPFKAIEKPNSVVSKINFGSNGNLAGVSDNEAFITTSRGEEVFSLELQNRLEDYFLDGGVVCLVNGAPFANAAEKLQPGTARWYDYDGKLMGEFPSGDSEAESISGISANNGLILLRSGDGYILTDSDGKEIWKYGAAEDILDIIPADKKRAVIAKKGKAEVNSLKMPKGSGESEL